MIRAVIVGALPAPPGDPTKVYAVADGAFYGLYLWDGAAFVRRANIDVGESHYTIVRREAATWPVCAYAEQGDWRLVGADANFTYWAIEVQLS